MVVFRTAHVELNLKLTTQLPQLLLHVIAGNQRMPPTKYFALCQVSVSRKHPAILPERLIN
jgi:hypothetical protein